MSPSELFDTLSTIFEPPLLAPPPPQPFLPRLPNYITGPIAGRWRQASAVDLARELTGLEPAEAEALVEFGALWLDDRPCFEARQPLTEHASFRLNRPAYGPLKFYEADEARLVYEDEELLIYNKESGRPSQGVPHDGYNNTLSALLRLRRRRGEGGKLWLLHRLDADTSGLLLMAKNKQAAGRLGRDFQRGLVEKRYLALGLGARPEGDFMVSTPIAKQGRRYVTGPEIEGLAARSSFSPLAFQPAAEGGDGQALFKAVPHTGRTHQLRLHLAWAGWPVAGDRFYGLGPQRDPSARLMLAACALSFTHPAHGRRLEISLPWPELKAAEAF